MTRREGSENIMCTLIDATERFEGKAVGGWWTIETRDGVEVVPSVLIEGLASGRVEINERHHGIIRAILGEWLRG